MRPPSDRLRIAVLLPHLGVYGGIRRFFELGRVWTDRGHDVLLATPGAPSPGAPSPGGAWLPFSGRIGTIADARGGSFDAVLSPDPALFLATEVPGALRVFYAVLEKAPGAVEAWRRADLVLGNSRGMIRHLERRGIRAADGVGAVNPAMFHLPASDARPERARSGVPPRGSPTGTPHPASGDAG
ncbi:MAG: hypothetical protein ACM3JJ_13290 [Hyphomicrobiales bacterium]